MATKLIANYSKRLGLPGYSSHQFSVSVETELVTTDKVARESQRLYELLQTSVDKQMEITGFVPDNTYGMDGDKPSSTVSNRPTNPPFNGGTWSCSEKQRELLDNLVQQHQLDKVKVEALAKKCFGTSVVRLNKQQMSGLLDILLEAHGGTQQRPGTRRSTARSGGVVR